MPQGGTASPSGTGAPRSRARGRLSRDEVAAAALELADREGLDALSMRRLAQSLGVGTMTLYGYFQSKRALLDAAVDAAFAGAPPAEHGGTWRERLRALVLGARRTLVLHPSLVEIRIRLPVLRPEALRLTERAVAILIEAGFAKRDAALAFRLIFVYSFGFAALSPAGAEEPARAAARSALTDLPPEEYPTLVGVVEEAAAAMGGEEVFAHGLELILDGLEARLREAQPSTRP